MAQPFKCGGRLLPPVPSERYVGYVKNGPELSLNPYVHGTWKRKVFN